MLTTCSKLVTTNSEQAVRAQLVDNLWTDLLQLVCRLVTTCAFYACSVLKSDLLKLVICRLVTTCWNNLWQDITVNDKFWQSTFNKSVGNKLVVNKLSQNWACWSSLVQDIKRFFAICAFWPCSPHPAFARASSNYKTGCGLSLSFVWFRMLPSVCKQIGANFKTTLWAQLLFSLLNVYVLFIWFTCRLWEWSNYQAYFESLTKLIEANYEPNTEDNHSWYVILWWKLHYTPRIKLTIKSLTEIVLSTPYTIWKMWEV